MESVEWVFEPLKAVFCMKHRDHQNRGRQKFARADKILDPVGPTARQKLSRNITLSSYSFIRYKHYYFTMDVWLEPLVIAYFYLTSFRNRNVFLYFEAILLIMYTGYGEKRKEEDNLSCHSVATESFSN